MKLEFRPERLALIRTREAHKLGLPQAVVKSAQAKLNFIEAAPDERSLRNWRSLNYKELEGRDDGLRQIRLNDQFRMELYVEGDPPVATIVAFGDPH
jgi:toxin HigB-1